MLIQLTASKLLLNFKVMSQKLAQKTSLLTFRQFFFQTVSICSKRKFLIFDCFYFSEKFFFSIFVRFRSETKFRSNSCRGIRNFCDLRGHLELFVAFVRSSFQSRTCFTSIDHKAPLVSAKVVATKIEQV